MSYTDKIIDSFNSDDEVDKTPEPTPAPEPVAAPEPVPAPEPVKAPEPVEAPKPAEAPEPKPDLSQVSKEAKAEHAFKRQLSKQKEKHEAEINDLKASFQKQFDEFKASLKQPEPVKTRDDFPLDKGGDEAYIKYLTKQGFDEAMAEQKAREAEEASKAEEERKAKAEKEEADEAMVSAFRDNSRRAFADETAYKEYSAKVNRAIDNGIGEILDTTPVLRDYIFRNPEGPVVLNKMLSDRDSFVRVMSQTDPTLQLIEAHELAKEATRPAPVTEPVDTTPKVPHLGKPGARNASSEAGSMFGSDKSLMAYVRSVGNRRR